MERINDSEFIGIEIGGTKLQLVAGKNDHIKDIIRYRVDTNDGASGIQKQIEEGITHLLLKYEVQAIGVGFGGPVDWHAGTIQVSHQIRGWAKFPLKKWIEDLTAKPVLIDNDANVAALAEAVLGHGKEFERVFYMTVGSGIGGGMIVDKEIYHGKAPGEVEIGHLRLDKHHSTLESKCSGWAVNKRVQEFIRQNPDSMLSHLSKNHNGPEASLLKPALENGDEAAITIVNEVSDDLAFALSHVVHLFHPDVMIIGGGLSFLNRYLVEPLQSKLSTYVMDAFQPVPPIKIAALGENVVPIGALQLAAMAFSKQGLKEKNSK